MYKVGVIGAGGFAAGELIQLLLDHEQTEVTLLYSQSQSGKRVSETHHGLVGESDLRFENVLSICDIYFLCMGHGASAAFLDNHPDVLTKTVIDLSQDFRIDSAYGFVYGLPEAKSESIKKSTKVANPGCFATSIALGLLPAIQAKAVMGNIHTSGITGSTGAGQSSSPTLHYSWRHGNASTYKPLQHQHTIEINAILRDANSDFGESLFFVPYRGAFTRGIITTSYFKTGLTQAELVSTYEDYFQEAVFTHVIDRHPDVKMVVNSNKCLIFPQIIDGMAVVVSVIDNLIKGAAGQAVQNMNLMLGLPERTGLQLKTSNF
ncbi:MAG: N-acetyl-gamma-glutamyl-phosphate reductase [Paraglaciecola sp.]|jgi:N-acetyl-gamma-glutamyl-phosphate reductase